MILVRVQVSIKYFLKYDFLILFQLLDLYLISLSLSLFLVLSLSILSYHIHSMEADTMLDQARTIFIVEI